MQDILDQLTECELNFEECVYYKKQILDILQEKSDKNYIRWLINTFHIDQNFKCLTNGKRVKTVQYGEDVHFSIDYSSNNEFDWETILYIIMRNDIVINVIYETDRYTRFEYIDREKYPYGSFQGKCLGLVYKNDHAKLAAINADISEIKQLCNYLIPN